MKKDIRIYSIISAIVLTVFLTLGTLFFWQLLSQFKGNPELFRQYLLSFGEGNSAVIFIGLQILQIVFPILPGEVLEVGAGYVFGAFMGLVLCEAGIVLASVPIFFMVKFYGKKLIYNIFQPEKLNKLSFLHNEKRLSFVVFLLFFIPGTPKDILTYFVGLTNIKPAHFILITVFARIPSIFTSTLVGSTLGEGKSYWAAVIYIITGAISLIGVLIYSRYIKNKSVHN